METDTGLSALELDIIKAFLASANKNVREMSAVEINRMLRRSVRVRFPELKETLTMLVALGYLVSRSYEVKGGGRFVVTYSLTIWPDADSDNG